MRGQGGFFDIDVRLQELSAKSDDLERLNAIVDFEVFRADLARRRSSDGLEMTSKPPLQVVPARRHLDRFGTLTLLGHLAAAARCDVYLLEGGIVAWKRAGLPVTTAA